ncbi:MAG TPA: hypothetical protein PKV86_13215, partial [Syntrophobacteraceae bacterium]|nr:hypothetical protein [Syntrophobacteraceae bacterium]
AALPLIIGILTSIYGGIAAMVILPFTIEQMTLMAIFLLIAHNMIQEGVIQAKSGIHPLKATLFRLAAAVITVIIVGQFLDTRSAVPMTSASPVSSHQGPFIEMLQNWGLATLLLSAKIFVIIMALLTLLEVLKELGWIHTFVNWLAPFLVVLGLDRKTGILWLTAVVFGLAYGAAVIVEEAGRGDLSGEELERLHLSIGINHSMVEDPILFMALGLSAFWLWVPRLVIAVVAVHLLRLWHWSRQRVSVGAVQQ